MGLTAHDADELGAVLLQIAQTYDAKLGRRDEYGQRYTIDFMLEWRGRRAMIRSGWIVEHSAETPRLTTCYPL